MPEMTSGEYERLFAAEGELWLSRALRRIATDALAPALSTGTAVPSILEVACGTGALLDALRPLGRPVGLDLSPVAVRYCRQRNQHHVVQASMTALPFCERAFDAVLCIDALGALSAQQDRLALGEMGRVCRPGGTLILWAAAHPILHGPHDRATGMVQRHRRRELRAKVEQAGFRITKLSYGNLLLFPGIALLRLFRRWRPPRAGGPSDVIVPARPVNELLARLLLFEAALLRRCSLPCGLSLLVVARRG